jgi:hypothetical protein
MGSQNNGRYRQVVAIQLWLLTQVLLYLSEFVFLTRKNDFTSTITALDVNRIGVNKSFVLLLRQAKFI